MAWRIDGWVMAGGLSGISHMKGVVSCHRAAVGLTCALQSTGQIEEEDLASLGDEHAMSFTCDQVLALSLLLFQSLKLIAQLGQEVL